MSGEKDDGKHDMGLKAAIRIVALTGAAFAVAATLFAGLRFGVGVLSGGLIAAVNLIVLARIVQAFLGNKGNAAPWAIVAVLKLVFLLGGVYLLVRSELLPVLSLAIGYMALPVGIVAASLFGPKPPDDSAP